MEEGQEAFHIESRMQVCGSVELMFLDSVELRSWHDYRGGFSEEEEMRPEVLVGEVIEVLPREGPGTPATLSTEQAYVLDDNKGGYNCLFDAFGRSLHPPERGVDLRSLCIRFWEGSYVLGQQGEEIRGAVQRLMGYSCEERAHQLRGEGEPSFGGLEELVFLSFLYRVRVGVYTQHSGIFKLDLQVTPTEDARGHCWLSLHGQHYSSLLPKGSCKTRYPLHKFDEEEWERDGFEWAITEDQRRMKENVLSTPIPAVRWAELLHHWGSRTVQLEWQYSNSPLNFVRARHYEHAATIAMDYLTRSGTCAKAFSTASDWETALPQLLTRSCPRVFYECIPPDTPVRLYLDLEWISHCEEDHWEEEISSKLTAQLRSLIPLAPKPELRVLKGSRWSEKGYKNSFHVIVPNWYFGDNTACMKPLVKELAESPFFRDKVDMGVYTKNRLFRLPLCYKLDDPSLSPLIPIGPMGYTVGEILDFIVSVPKQTCLPIQSYSTSAGGRVKPSGESAFRAEGHRDYHLAEYLGRILEARGLHFKVQAFWVRDPKGATIMSASAEHMTDCPGGEVAHRTCSLKLQVGRDGRVEVRCASCTGLSGHVGNVVPSQFHCLSAPGMAAPLPPPPVNCCDLLCQQYPEGTVISRSPHVVRIKEATRIAVQGVQRTEKVGFCLWGGEEWLSSEIVDWCNQQWCTRMGWNWGEQTDYPQAPLITQSKFFEQLHTLHSEGHPMKQALQLYSPAMMEGSVPTVVIPVKVRNFHWTTAILHRKSRIVELVDSLSGFHYQEMRSLRAIAEAWVPAGVDGKWGTRFSRTRTQYDATNDGVHCLLNGWLRAGRWRCLETIARSSWANNIRGWLAFTHWASSQHPLVWHQDRSSSELGTPPLKRTSGQIFPQHQSHLIDFFWASLLDMLRDGAPVDWTLWDSDLGKRVRHSSPPRGVSGPFPSRNVHKASQSVRPPTSGGWKRTRICWETQDQASSSSQRSSTQREGGGVIPPVEYGTPASLKGETGSASCPPRVTRGNWESLPHWPGTDWPFITLNMGQCGLIPQLVRVSDLLNKLQPAAVLLQECRISGRALKKTRAQLRTYFPDYTIFVSTNQMGTYWLSLVTLIHKGISSSTVLRRLPDETLTGRLMTIVVPETHRRTGFWLSNVHQEQASRGEEQANLLRVLGRRSDEANRTGIHHLIMGDFNATSHDSDRRGYTGITQTKSADDLLRTFICSHLHRSRKIIRMDQRSGDYDHTWQSHDDSHSAKLDHAFLHCPQAKPRGGSRLKGNISGSPLHTLTWPREATYSDHCPLVVFADTGLTGQKPVRREDAVRIDVEAWGDHKELWSETVGRLAPVSLPEDASPEKVFQALDHASQVMSDLLPRVTVSGRKTPSPPHRSQTQRKLDSQLTDLGKAVEELRHMDSTSFRVTAAMRKSSWPNLPVYEGAEHVPQLPTSISEESLDTFKLSLLQACKERRTLHTRLLKAQIEENRTDFRNLGSGKTSGKSVQFKRLLGKEVSADPPQDRYSKDPDKQHPDSVRVQASQAALTLWLSRTFGPDLGDLFSTWASTGEVQRCFDGPQRVRVQKFSEKDFLVTVRPVHYMTYLLRTRPSEIRPDQLEVLCQSPEAEFEADILSQEETFFGMNALSTRTGCAACGHPKLQILSEPEHDQLWYHCRSCKHLTTSFQQFPMPTCPLPDEIFTERQFPPGAPVLKGDLTFEEFEAILFSRTGNGAPGEDLLSYQMWQAAPKHIRRILYLAVLAMLRGHRLPKARWKVAMVTLLLKKLEEIHLLENVRPICLLRCGLIKMFTTILKIRLDAVSERYHIHEEEEEGFRECRSTRRAHFKQQCLIAEARRTRSSLFITYLDFKNFFNSINKEVLFHVLEKLGMHPDDLQILRTYYEDMAFFVRNPCGDTCLIPLDGNGLHQGCPLSPSLGGFLIRILIRFLKHAGVGFSFVCGARTNSTGFADDVTLVTSTDKDHQLLYDRVDVFCQWTLLVLNLIKSEVTAYHFGLQKELPIQGLRLVGGRPTRLPPQDAFKYLGIRGSITGSYESEKAHVRDRTKEQVEALRNSEVTLDPAVVDEIVRVAIIPIFRYSCPLVPWTATELGEIARLWDSAYRVAWKVGRSFPAAPFRFPEEQGGMQIPDPWAVLARECHSLITQIMEVHDGLRDIFLAEVGHTLREQGVTTMPGLQEELYLSITPTTPLPSLIHRMAWSFAVLGVRASWPELTASEDAEGGILSMTHPNRRAWLEQAQASRPPVSPWAGPRGGRWLECLRELCRLGRHTTASVKAQFSSTTGWSMAFPESVCSPFEQPTLALELKKLFGWNITFEAPRSRPASSMGQARASQLESRPTGEPSTKRRATGSLRREPGIATALGDCLVGVSKHSLQVRGRAYLCKFASPFTDDMMHWSHGQSGLTDQLIAEELVARRAVFFLPAELHPQQCQILGNGWWLQAQELRWCNQAGRRRAMLRYVCLNRQEPYYEGDIYIDYGASSLKQVLGWHSSHPHLHQTYWVMEEDLLPREVTAYLPDPLWAYWHGSRDPIPPDILFRSRQCGRHRGFLDLKKRDGEVTGRGDGDPSPQASWLPGHKDPASSMPRIDCTIVTSSPFRFELPVVEGWQIRWVKAHVEVRRAQPHPVLARRHTLQQARSTQPNPPDIQLEGARWGLLQDERTGAPLLGHIRSLVAQQESLESAPLKYRTLDWHLTSAICRVTGVKRCTGSTPLDVNPIFSVFSWLPEECDDAFLNLVFLTPDQMSTVLSRLRGSRGWVALLHSPPRNFPGRRHHTFLATEDRLFRKKGWWRTGDSSCYLAKRRLELWASQEVQLRTDKLLQMWEHPYAHPLDAAEEPTQLKRYLDMQSGGEYRHVSGHLIACDGALRKRGDSWIMGAGAVCRGQQGPLVRSAIGSAYERCSSARAELGALTLSMFSAPVQGDLTILMDSLAICRRLITLRRVDFRPQWSKVKDTDMLPKLAQEIQVRRDKGQRITIAHVYGHVGMLYNDKADDFAVAGALTGEYEFEDLLPEPGRLILEINALDDRIEEPHIMPWCVGAVQALNRQAALWYMEKTKSSPGCTETFLLRENQGRKYLGDALRRLWVWDAVEVLRSVGFQSRTRAFLLGKEGTCPDPRCQGALETYDHLQFVCQRLAGPRQSAHDAVAEALEQGIGHTLPEDAVQGWNQSIKRTLSRDDMGSSGNLKPDGLILLPTSKQIFILEVARTSDSREHFEGLRENEKERHYHALAQELSERYSDHRVQRLTFIIGARGSFREDRWHHNLSMLGITAEKQAPVLEAVVRAALRGSAFVMRAYRKL